VFPGDLGGNFHALDAANGWKLWGQELGGAPRANDRQRHKGHVGFRCVVRT
jgi:hypothetical protein